MKRKRILNGVIKYVVLIIILVFLLFPLLWVLLTSFKTNMEAPTNRKIDKHSADAKFQISIRQRLTKSILPFKTFLYLTYTQRSFWDIYGKSSPFLDNNFNPGLSLSKALIYRNQLMFPDGF